MRNWKAIIFDMDGTLFDTETISMKAWKRVGETLQLPTSDEFILSLIGRTRKDQQVVFDSYMSKDWPQEEACSLHTQFKKEEKLKNGVPLMGDVKGLLDTVKAKGYTIAMATSASADNVRTLTSVPMVVHFASWVCSLIILITFCSISSLFSPSRCCITKSLIKPSLASSRGLCSA